MPIPNNPHPASDAKKVESELQAHYSQLETQLKAKATTTKQDEGLEANSGKWIDA